MEGDPAFPKECGEDLCSLLRRIGKRHARVTPDPEAVIHEQSAQRQVYAPLALLALVGGLTFRQRRKDAQRNDEAEKK